ncbi:MAG: hypothetical protein KF893_06565 [Caldilineaceae bacterium]|nr:hypothetical protein [Caldilineaceae bacterium]
MFTAVSRSIVAFCFAAVLLAGCIPIPLVLPVEPQPSAPAVPPQQTDREAKIQNAMSAAPPAIAENATVIDWPSEAHSEPALLHQGSNQWTCMPDWPATPGNDPMCFDPIWAAWMNAFMMGAEPEVTALGVMYMLVGGSDASNTDPFATQPPEGEEWLTWPPHIMLLRPDGFDTDEFTTDYTSGKPWIMWEGTPYEHLMIPVVAGGEATDPVAPTDSVEAKLRNILGAAPQSIAEGAMIMDWPASQGSEMAMLREGSNDWLCVPDWPATPDNDPMCFDPTWTAWMGAFMSGAAPEVSTLGVSYMLSGGEYADASDPFAAEPPAGKEWVRPPAHVMLIAPGGFDTAQFTTDPTTGNPWIVWEGTPYEFLIVPVE